MSGVESQYRKATIMRWKRFVSVFLFIVSCCAVGMLSGCDREDESIVVYSGKGLEKPMEEIRRGFESRYSIQVNIIYAGSDTLLEAIKKSRQGDVFIPGTVDYIEDAGNLVLDRQYVAQHILAFAVHKDNPKNIRTVKDLLQPGLKIAAGHKEMCAIGRISKGIFSSLAGGEYFINNIALTGATVNELLDLVVQREVDAAMIWKDMMLWPGTEDLLMIEIPATITEPEEIHVAVLATTKSRKNADLFFDFVARESKAVFLRHGFGE